MSDELTGADDVVEAIPALVVGVLPSHQDVLVAHELGSLVDDPGAALHPDGVAALEVRVELGTVAAAFVMMTLEVLVLIEEDLQSRALLDQLVATKLFSVALFCVGCAFKLNTYILSKCLDFFHLKSYI